MSKKLVDQIDAKRAEQVAFIFSRILPTLGILIIGLFMLGNIYSAQIFAAVDKAIHPTSPPRPTATHTLTPIPTFTATFTLTPLPTFTTTPTTTPLPLRGKSEWDGNKIYKYPRISDFINIISKEQEFQIWGWCLESDNTTLWLYVQAITYYGWVNVPSGPSDFVPISLLDQADSKTLIREKGIINLLPPILRKICVETGTLTPVPFIESYAQSEKP